MLQAIQVGDDYLPLYNIYTNTSVYQNIRMTWNFDWNVIINVTYNVSIVR